VVLQGGGAGGGGGGGGRGVTGWWRCFGVVVAVGVSGWSGKWCFRVVTGWLRLWWYFGVVVVVVLY